MLTETVVIMQRVVALTIGCALVAGVAGCTSTRPAAPRITGTGVSAAMTDIATRSGRWPAGARKLQDAFDRLDHQCVMKAGFRLPATPEVSLPVPEDEAAVIDLDGRRRHGYGISTPDDGSEVSGDPHGYASSLSADDRRRLGEAQFGPGTPRTPVTLNGKGRVTVPSAGCVARARKALAGDLRTWANIYYGPQQLDDQLGREALADTRYQATLGQWRSCMAHEGYAYASPDAIVARLQRRYEQGAKGSTFKHGEISVAVADGECQKRSHLPTRLLQVRRTLVARLPVNDLSFLRSLATSWEAAVAHARSVLTTPAEHGSPPH